MKICVFGLWHLGCVTSACLADKGFEVVGLDPNEETIKNLNKGKLPIFEPNLEELINKNIHNNLTFTTNIESALKDTDIIWVTFDTPVDDNDNADIEYVRNQIISLFPFVTSGTTILISSQLPVGSTSEIEKILRTEYTQKCVYFAYSPENLRLGKAIEGFNNPDRIIVGTNCKNNLNILNKLFKPIEANIFFMSIESAEMTKHALNSFLATEIAFINEIATICERVGADISDVEKALKSDSRIGEKAYLKAGSAYSGGTLARDLMFLNNIKSMNPLSSVIESNDEHKMWAFSVIREHFDLNLNEKNIAVLGLTYKPNTDTLRRSGSVELCKKLLEFGANIKTHDPSINELPKEYSKFNLCKSLEDAVKDVDLIVISTEWKIYKSLNFGKLSNSIVVVDANGFIRENFVGTNVKYYSIGRVYKCC